MTTQLSFKLSKLQSILSSMKKVLVAFSGGVDSTLLLKVAKDVLGDKVLAVTAESEICPVEEIKEAKKIAKSLGVRHIIIHTNELLNNKFTANPPDRCYFCKKELFSRLSKLANGKTILDGSNADDFKDYRPGSRAKKEYKVRSPLAEVGFTKKEIRSLSKTWNLCTWNKPAMACLASRFPYGMSITKENLKRVAEAEKFLKRLGLKQVRVRHHGKTARIEVLPEDSPKVIKRSKEIVGKLKKLGYTYITYDLEGYRSGSMNEVLRG